MTIKPRRKDACSPPWTLSDRQICDLYELTTTLHLEGWHPDFSRDLRRAGRLYAKELNRRGIDVRHLRRDLLAAQARGHAA